MLNFYVFRADDTALQGGEKIAGKWAHLKAAEEGEGRIRLDYECREKGETMKKQKERTEGKRRFFHFAKANGPSFAEGNLREDRRGLSIPCLRENVPCM